MSASKIKTNLTDGKILPRIILFALPLIATSVLHLLFNTASAWDMLLSETAHSILTALLRSSLTVGTNLSLCNFHPQVLILSPGTTQKKPNPSSSFHTVSRSKI